MITFLLSKDNSETLWELIPDLARFPELRWLNAHHWVPGFIAAVSIFIFGGIQSFFWGFMVRSVLPCNTFPFRPTHIL
jgi:stearoyl-CoA desaturase (Delta-9 desaturase)